MRSADRSATITLFPGSPGSFLNVNVSFSASQKISPEQEHQEYEDPKAGLVAPYRLPAYAILFVDGDMLFIDHRMTREQHTNAGDVPPGNNPFPITEGKSRGQLLASCRWTNLSDGEPGKSNPRPASRHLPLSTPG